MVKAQEYIKQNLFDRKLKILDLKDQELEEHLDLSEFTELEELNCSYNELTSLDVSKCKNLKKIDCSYNLFDDLSFLTQLSSPEKLVYLNIEENGTFISLEEKLKMLIPFINLEKTEEEKVIGSLIGQLNKNEEHSEQEISKLKEENFRLEEENNKLKNNQKQFEKEMLELKNHQIELTNLQQQNTQLLNKLTKQEKKLVKYQNILQARQSSLQKLETERNELEAKLKIKEKETSVLQEKTNKLQTELNEVRENYHQMAVKLNAEKDKFLDANLIETELQKARENIERLEKELTEAEESLENNQEQILNLQKELLDKNREVKRVRAEKQIESDALQTEKDKLKLEFDNLKIKLESNKKELKQKKQELNETKKSLEKEKLNKSIGLTRELRRQEEKLKKEVKNLKEKNQKLEKQLVNKEKQIITINDDIENNPVKPSLEKMIGKGGYGEVHYGKWKLQDVAVKKLYLSPNNASPDDIQEITNEINILKNLRNRYIIQYYGIYSDKQELLIIMDYAENGTLTKFINDNKDKEHNWSFNNEIIKQMALGLVYIHQENIIHRDLKSLNILLANNYEVKISDFGLSRTKNINSSQSKDIKGTLGWMAPELLRGKKYSEQSDIYALGMIIWEMVAKCTEPFKGIDYNSLMFHIIDGGKETIPSNTPQNIRVIIKQCWKDNPNERVALEKIIEDVRLVQPINTKHSLDYKNSKTQNLGVNEQGYSSSDLGLNINDLNLNIEEEVEEDNDNKDRDWVNIHSGFTPELIQLWTNYNFTYQQTQDWINAGLQLTDANFASWLRDVKQVEVEWVLNNGNLENLNQEFFQWWQGQQFSDRNPS